MALLRIKELVGGNIMQEVYLIITNYETRNKICGVFTKETVQKHYELMDSCKPDNWIRKKLGNFNIKYYSIDENNNEKFEEQLYIQKNVVVGS